MKEWIVLDKFLNDDIRQLSKELIRCRNCNLQKTSDCPMKLTPYMLPDNWFCAYGIPKEEE